jgi:hypothetical protein
MAPVTLCTTPKNAVQLATETDIRRFLEFHPGASEILTTSNAKRPFFQKTILTGHQIPIEEIVNSHLAPAEGEIRELIESRFGSIEAIKIKGMFYQGLQDDKVTWKTVLRLILAGTQVDDYTKLRKSCPSGFDRDVYTLRKVLPLEGFQPGRTTGFMEQFVQAQDDDSLVWLVDPPNDIDIKYRETKAEFEKTHFKLMNPVGYLRFEKKEIQYMKRKDLFDAYENKFIDGSDEQFVKRWVRDPEMKTYEKFTFAPPPLPCPANVLNTWKGYEAEEIKERGGSASKFVEHLDMLFGKNSNYVLKWLANIIQNPGKPSGVALVIAGGQGTGKSTIFEKIMYDVMGSEYFGQTSQPDIDIFGRFATLKNSKILVVVEDYNVGTLKMNADPFKSYITGRTVNYESKGMNSVELPNCANYVMLSNKNDAVKIDQDDRRHAIFEPSEKYKQDPVYFNELYAYIADKANIRAIYEFLRDLDISNVNFQAERPITELYHEIKNMSVDKEIVFLNHKVAGFEKPQEFRSMDYYQDFRIWLAENGFSEYKPKDTTRFGMYMKRVPGVTIERRTANVGYYVIDPIKIPQLS